MSFSDIPNPKAAAEEIENFRKRIAQKVCLAPSKDCDGRIVSAHTLSVEAMLRPISRGGKVYSWKSNLYSPDQDNLIKFVLCGLNEVSVFNGFCEKHDKQLFAPIEDKPFVCSYEQIFLFAFRAAAKESYLKRKQTEHSFSVEKIKQIHNLPDGIDFQLSPKIKLFQKAAIHAAEEVERIKSKFDLCLQTKDFTRLRTIVIPFASKPTLTCNFVYNPDFDFAGNYLQDFKDLSTDLSQLFITILPGKSSDGFAIFSYFDTANSAPQKLVESLLSQADLTSSLIWLVACQAENFAISPDWYENLSSEQKNAFNSGFFSNVDFTNFKLNQLKDCKFFAASWNPQIAFSL